MPTYSPPLKLERVAATPMASIGTNMKNNIAIPLFATW